MKTQSTTGDAELIRLAAMHGAYPVVVAGEDGTIRFLNPAAEVMFAGIDGPAVGEAFPFPLGDENAPEVTTVRREADNWSAEMTVAEARWEGRKAYVISLRDASERDRLRGFLRSTMILDELTGLLNRRGFMTLTQQQLKLAARSKQGLLLILAAVDDMPSINEVHGRSTGDVALMETANIIRTSFRDSDILARMSGDLFAITAIEAHSDSAGILVARLRENFWEWNAKDSRGYQLSVSLGMARFDSARPCSMEALMVDAQRQLTEQQRGKGRAGINRQGIRAGTYEG